MGIFFIKSGILTTIQDLGRNGYRRFGINQNGAMDRQASRLLNILLGNSENSSVLEMHFPAPEIRFERDAVIATGGANFGARIENTCLSNWETHFIKPGQTLTFPKKLFGNRAYLAIKGGFEIENWLGSSSTNLQAQIGGFQGRKIKKGDSIRFCADILKPSKSLRISQNLIPDYSKEPTIRIIEGAEMQYVTGFSEEHLFSEQFTITLDSNRMGFQILQENRYLC